MTICIASIAEDGKSLILTSDKELTYPMLITEVESDTKKIIKITDKIFILMAGNGVYCAEIVREVVKDKNSATNVKEVAEATLVKYQELREKKMLENFLRPRGFTSLSDYNQKQQQLNPQIAVGLDNLLANDPNKMFDVSLIVAGIDDTGAHIYAVEPPGSMVQADSNGFAAIGIGSVHAFNSLLGNNYTSKLTLKEALYFIYEAKKRSEAAPGVGELTDTTIVTGNDESFELSDDEIKELDNINQEIKDTMSKTINDKISKYQFPSKSKEDISQKSTEKPKSSSH